MAPALPMFRHDPAFGDIELVIVGDALKTIAAEEFENLALSAHVTVTPLDCLENLRPIQPIERHSILSERDGVDQAAPPFDHAVLTQRSPLPFRVK